jgi:CheY-like chemotaxis protein
MYFPRAYKSAEGRPSIAAPSVKMGNGQTLMVVEDDPDVREFVSETLRDLKYNVVALTSPEAALTHIKSAAPVDAILTDVVMPGTNGRELADAVSLLSPTIKIVFMTGYSRDAIVHHGRLDPGVLLLQKPFSREELSSRIYSLFSN